MPRSDGARLRRTLSAAVVAIATTLAATTSATVGATPPDTPSAIGSQGVFWIVVSPAYARTGVVVALASPTSGCSQDCQHLWVTRDGGASWRRPAGTGWQSGRFIIAVDGAGREVLLSGSGSSVQRSDDLGESWTGLGTGGMPVAAPSYASDGAVAVAGPQDYMLRGTTSTPVQGSGGVIADLTFMLAPGFPAGGAHAPALLSGADQSSKAPVIQRCTAALACTGATTLPGAGPFSVPVTLLPSTGYQHDGVVFAQSGRGVYKSLDGGLNFAPLAIVPDNGASATATPMLQLAAQYSESGPVRTAYAAVLQAYIDAKNAAQSHSAGGVFRSDDGGATWHSISAGTLLDGGATSVAVTPDGRMFAGYVQSTSGAAGLLCNAGAGWTAVCPAVRTGSQGGVAGGGQTAPPGASLPAGGAATPAGGAAAASATGAPGGSASSPGHASDDTQLAAPAVASGASSGGRAWVRVAGFALAIAVLVGGLAGIRRYARGPSPPRH